MNERQLRLFVRHAFSLTNAEKTAVKGANPAFTQAMTQIRQLVEGLPPEALLQQRAWDQLRPQVMAALRPYNDSFRASLYSTLEEADPEIRQYAQKSLEAVRAPVPIGTTGEIAGAPAGGLQAFGNPIIGGTTEQALRRTSIADVRLDRLFRVDRGRTDSEVSLWMRQNYKTIDKVVRGGIIQGATTEAIAAQVSEEATLGGLLRATKGTAAGSIKAQARTIARTAVQSFNHQVKEQVWDANADALEGLVYEWSAAMDSRVCPTCGPLDGQKKKKRSDLPTAPLHPNCRCGVVPVDPDDDDDVRTGIELSSSKPQGKGAYKTQVTVNGKKYYRKAVEIKKPGATYADYLADLARKDTQNARLTLSEYFGGAGKAGDGESTLGVQRADWFIKTVKSGVAPSKALKHLVTRPDSVTKLRSFKTEWTDLEPPKSKPKPKPRPKPPAPAAAKPKPKAKPKAATPRPEPSKQESARQYVQDHQWDNGKNKLSSKAIADSLEAVAQEKGLAGENMRRVMEFQRKKKIQTMWSTGREKVFNAKGDDYAHWKNPEVIEALRTGEGKGVEFVRSIADSLEKGSNSPFLDKLGRTSSRAAGHTVEGGHFIVMKQEAQFKQITKAGVQRIREVAARSVEAAKNGTPKKLVNSGLYKQVGKSFKTEEGWLVSYVHEMGHQIHFRAGTPSIGRYINDGLADLSPLQQRLEIGKRNWIPSEYGASNQLEQFAETFAQYVFAPDELKKANPAAYRWVDETMREALK